MNTPSLTLTLRLQRGTGRAVPEQVAAEIRGWIRDGRLATGQALPVLRSLARSAGAHPSLIARGLERLEREGWLERGEFGYRVADRLPLDSSPEALDRQIESAREVQQRLLPDDLTSDELRIVSYFDSLHEVSGDLFDWFSDTSGRRWAIAVGDVAGKGLAAGMVMASVQTALRMSAGRSDPASVLNDLNLELVERTRARDFVALTLLHIDLDRGRLRAAAAGAPDIFLRNASGLSTVNIPGPHLPLGLRPAVAYESREITLAPGDQLVVTTDGLPETPTGDGDLLGYTRFEERIDALTAQHPCQRTKLHDFVSELDRELGGRPSDDRTLLWIQIAPPIAG
ncbi:MAG: SpoIIE family protein phosphatase [Acidobacteriota bacterium]